MLNVFKTMEIVNINIIIRAYTVRVYTCKYNIIYMYMTVYTANLLYIYIYFYIHVHVYTCVYIHCII